MVRLEEVEVLGPRAGDQVASLPEFILAHARAGAPRVDALTVPLLEGQDEVIGVVAGMVVHDRKLEVPVVLVDRALQAAVQGLDVVARWHQDGDDRRIHAAGSFLAGTLVWERHAAHQGGRALPQA